MTGGEKRELLRRLLDERRRSRETAPLSFAQERLFFLERLLPGTPLYNIPSVIPVDERLDPGVLDRALQEIVARHEVFRTSFDWIDGEPRRRVQPRLEMMLDVVDLRQASRDVREREVRWLAEREAQTPFDLRVAPLARACLLRCRGATSCLLWTVHHIISDAWSAEIVIDELRQLYAAFSSGRPSPLAALPMQYADYARWQREQLAGGTLDRLVRFWRSRLEGAPELLDLPADRPRPKRPTFRGGVVSRNVEPDVVAALVGLGHEERATLFMTLQAAFVLLLRRFTGATDIVIGTPAANRSRQDTEKLVGFFVNTLVLRHDLGGDPTFRELLRSVRETTLSAFDHQDLPFEKLVEELQPARSTAHNPVFQVMFVFQTVRSPSPGAAAGVDAGAAGNGTAKFDLTLFASASDSAVLCGWEFSRDLFDEETVQRLARQYGRLLGQAAANPETRASDFELMDADERRAWLAVATGPSRSPGDARVDRLFDAQADLTPDALAIDAPGARLTYRALKELARALAAQLAAAGAEPGEPIGVLLPRSWEAMTAVLAVLKCGCPYVPIDPSYPAERVRAMIEGSGARILVRRSEDATTCALPGCEIATLRAGARPADPRAAGETDVIGADPLAYIMFTSGSTGTPKGVMMPHRSLANLLAWQLESEQGRPRRTLQFAPLSFDVSFQEIFSTLLAGATLVVPPDDLRHDFARLWTAIVERSIQRIFLPYVALQALAEAAVAGGRAAPDLELVVTAGEQLLVTPAIVTMFSRLAAAELWNQYGPTETHVVTQLVLRGDPRGWPARPTIGRPIANAAVLVLDDFGRPAPVGTPGEINVAGLPVARGYWRAPEMTAERFVSRADFGPASRFYRTGDRGRFLNDGSIEFLGRADDQVKIRGFRVEPGEVRAALLQHPDVAEAAVVPHALRSGEVRLVACVTRRGAADDPAALDLRGWCARRLPDYMIPARFVELSVMPLTPSGKIAVRTLAAMQGADEPAEDKAGGNPSPTEAAVLELVEEVLEITSASLQQDFFSLGGHSLIAMRLLSRIRERFGVEIPLQRLFDRATLGSLAAEIDAHAGPARMDDAAEQLLAAVEAMSEAEVAVRLHGRNRQAETAETAETAEATGSHGGPE